MKKTGGQKSRDTLPLIPGLGVCSGLTPLKRPLQGLAHPWLPSVSKTKVRQYVEAKLCRVKAMWICTVCTRHSIRIETMRT